MSLDFWNKVEKTNPDYTKTGKVSGQIRTSVDAQFKKKMISEQFGMYGIGWGVEPGSEEYLRIEHGTTVLLNYTAIAFYVHEGDRGSFPIAAQIKEAYVTNGGQGYLKVDDEAVKKVRTDALTKGFTDLGFCADIHLGKFDDQDYVEGVKKAQQLADAEDRESEARRVHGEIKEWLEQNFEFIAKVPADESAVKALERLRDKTIARCDAASIASAGLVELINQAIEKRNEGK